MNKIMLILLLLLAGIGISNAQVRNTSASYVVTHLKSSGGGPACYDWKTNSNIAQDVIACTLISIAHTNDTGVSITICAYGADLYSNSTGDAHVEIWTGPNATGTKIGTSSQPRTITGNASPQYFEFTWNSFPTISANVRFYTVLVTESGQVISRLSVGGAYGNVFIDGVVPVAGGFQPRFYIRKQ